MPRERSSHSQNETRFALGPFSGPITISVNDVKQAVRKNWNLFLRVLSEVPSDRREAMGEFHDKPAIRRNNPGSLL